MRAIDADIAISLIQEDKIEGKTLDIIKALGDGLQAETLNQACDRHIKIINTLPTIEVEPVKHGVIELTYEEYGELCSYALADEPKHGEWLIDKSGSLMCSKCGTLLDEFQKPSRFCPNCGARMDGGEWEEPEINPCRGCTDYDGKGGCISNGGCGARMDLDEVKE